MDNTDFEGLLVLQPKVFEDARGYFFESYNTKVLDEKGIAINFVQDNQSRSRKGVVRGLHFQNAPYAQTKLVRVLEGEILDVVVDLRKDKPSFGKHFSIILSAENKKQLLVPKGFAHGFVVLSQAAEVLYKCDNFYHQPSDGGILFNDPDLGINWTLHTSELILSEKDQKHQRLKDSNFLF